MGCNFDLNHTTHGALHQANFTYVSGACLFGCAVDQPMTVGSTGTVVISGDRLPDELRVHADDGFTLTIADPKVSVLRQSFDFIDLEDPGVSDVLAASSGTLIARAAGATNVNVNVNVTAGKLMRAVPVEVK